MPLRRAEDANWAALLGLRWAEAMVISKGIPSFSKTPVVSAMTPRSESLPITIPTFGFCSGVFFFLFFSAFKNASYVLRYQSRINLDRHRSTFF